MKVGDVSYLYDRIDEREIEEAIVGEGFRTDDMLLLTTKNGREIIQVYNEKLFIYMVAKAGVLEVPIWKVIIPGIRDGMISYTGANYYIMRSPKKIVFFRGTYGYGGTGVHQSAFIEKALKMLRLPIDERDGDYLLTLLGLYEVVK